MRFFYSKTVFFVACMFLSAVIFSRVIGWSALPSFVTMSEKTEGLCLPEATPQFLPMVDCGESFFDAGGPNGNYPLNQLYNAIICPTEPNSYVEVTFNSFETQVDDHLLVFAGTQIGSIQLGNYSGNELPPIISSVDVGGCLAFTFQPESSQSASGWDATVDCVSCPRVYDMKITDLHSNSIVVTYGGFPLMENVELEVGLPGFVPGGGQAISTGNGNFLQGEVNGLTADTDYDLYARIECSQGGFGAFRGPLRFHSSPSCGDIFYDNGGENGDLDKFQSIHTYLCPDQAGTFLKLDFEEFDLSQSVGTLYAFDSPDFSAQLETGYSNEHKPTMVYATNPSGCLSFELNATSNLSTSSGWKAAVECVSCPTFNKLTLNSVTKSVATISWPSIQAGAGFQWEIGPHGFIPGTGNASQSGTTSNTTISVSGLQSSNSYDFYNRIACANGSFGDWAKLEFSTIPGCGDFFYDPGGPDEDYSLGQATVTTICPDVPGSFVQVDFQEFNLDTCCSNYLQIFDDNTIFGNTTIGYYYADNNPGIISANNLSGCLSFLLYTNSIEATPSWVASVSCVTCPKISYVGGIGTGASTADIYWAATPNAVYYHYEIVPIGMLPETGSTVKSGDVASQGESISNLASGTYFDLYVKANCGGSDESVYTGPSTFHTYPSCGDHFYDSGGPTADFEPYNSFSTTICPDFPGSYIQLDFQNFDIGPCCSGLTIYDGMFPWDPILAGLAWNTNATIYSATNSTGCLYVYFNANGPNAYPGWDALVNCVSCPTVSGININSITSSTVAAIWNPLNGVTTYDYEIGTVGFVPGTGNSVTQSTTNTNSLNANGLESGTDYELYVRSHCSSNDLSAYSGPIKFSTNPTCGDLFTDPWGNTGNLLPNGQTNITTICPDISGTFAEVVFNELDLGDCCSYIYVYDSPTTNNTIYTLTGTSLPQTIAANNNSGCLTFEAYYASNTSGWAADVNCVSCPGPNSVAVIESSGGSAILQLGNVFSGVSYDWEIGPLGFVPFSNASLQSGTSSQNTVTINGLAGGISYDFYVKTTCGNGSSSAYSNPEKVDMPPSCGELFTDDGGPNGNYSPNTYSSNKICPNESGQFVELEFTEFEVNNCCAYLDIYNGTTGYSYSGSNRPVKIMSNAYNGCIEANFYSSSLPSETQAGFQANVKCVSCAYPNFVNLIGTIFNDKVTVDWNEVPTAVAYDWELLLPGNQPGTGQSISAGTSNTSQITIDGLESSTTYNFYIRTLCENGEYSEFSRPLKFTTSPTCGEMFYDASGPDSGYVSGNIFYINTICPDIPGTFAQVTFNELNIHPWEDNISVYDGETQSAPQISYFNGMATFPLPGPFLATNPTGCLTFVFGANGGGIWEGWEASVECITCPPITNLVTNNINGFFLSWDPLSTAESYYYEIVLNNVTPGTGQEVLSGTVTENNVQVLGLDAGVTYVAYVRANCGGGEVGAFSNGAPFINPATCGDNFYDFGGPNANYTEYSNYETVICSQNIGEPVTVTFSSFVTEACCDYMYVYDGNSSFAPFLANIAGQPSLPLTFTSSNVYGCLTFYFSSNGSINYDGWEAEVTCGGCTVPTNFVANNVTSTGVALSWTGSSDVTSFNYEIGAKGFIPGIGTSILDSNVFSYSANISQLNAGFEYDAYVRSVCGTSDVSNFAGPISFATPVSCGSISYDSGGPNNDYGPNEDYFTLICPEVNGNVVWLDFSEFETQACCDHLEILNGSSQSSPSLGSFSGNSLPGLIASSDPSGCLTLHFTSDATINRSGWKADVFCGASAVGQVLQQNALKVSPNPAKDWLQVSLLMDGEGTISIVDVAGRTKWVINALAGQKDLAISVADLPEGVYFLRWQAEVVKFVVSR